MNWNLILGLISAVAIVVALVAILWLTRPRCSECGSYEIGETSKEPLGMRDTSYHSGGGGGGYSSTQIMYRVTFQCNRCQAKWTKTTTETR